MKPPEDANMRVPNEVLKCVCFLCVKSVSGQGIEQYSYGGTGFFVGIQSDKHKDLTYVYLITAKHCIQKAEGKGGLYLRLNTKDGKSKVITAQREWFYSNNVASDVAVLPWAPSNEVFDYLLIRKRMCATDELINREGIGLGDDLVITGLFTAKYGVERNTPIVRIGSIAAMPTEKLEDEYTGLYYQAYIAEVRSIGGLSGSPVFVLKRYSEHRGDELVMNERAFLLGLVRGHWDYKQRDSAIDYVSEELKDVNMGMAIITPIQDAIEIIDGEELVNDRRKQDRERSNRSAPTMDGQFTEGDDYTKEDFLRDLKKVSQKKSDE